VIYGSAGIGKSTLLQLLLLRELVKGVPVLLHLRGVNILVADGRQRALVDQGCQVGSVV
jgi:ABC-type lipoprotein export system ATPase subunit